MKTYLEVILFVNGYSWTENVSHDNEVRVGVTDGDAIHSQILWKTSICILLYNVLKYRKKDIPDFLLQSVLKNSVLKH